MKPNATLSDTQRDAMNALNYFESLDAFGAIMHVGRNYRRTLAALEARGFVRFFPSSQRWRLTVDGRREVKSWRPELNRTKEYRDVSV